MKKVVGLDVGTKTIGVAKGFCETQMIFPLCTLKRKSVKRDAEKLVDICIKEGVSLVVLGLPLRADGSEGRMARLARQIGNALKEQTELEVVYQDESDSSLEAQERLYAANRHSRYHKAVIDQEAAIVIVERWFLENA